MRVQLVRSVLSLAFVLLAHNLQISAAHAAPAASADASPTRGLKVVAADPVSKAQSEVKLYDKSFAVVIGIDQYKHLPPDRQLKFAVRDAQGVQATLDKHYKFDKIVSLYNQDATRARILDLLTDELPRQMGENDSLFVFFAGHGDQIKRGPNEIGYLIPHDGQVDRLSSVISMADLKDTVSKAIPAKHVFYVIDACYGGLMTTTRAIDKTPRRDLAYLQEITQERVRQVLTAGGKGEEVLDGGPKGHSVFTGRLIEVLEKTGDFITANEIQSILKEKVFGDARARGHTQTPAYGTLYGSGDFVFIPSLEQKVADNKAEIAKLQAELAALDAAEARAKTAASSAERQRQQREAEAARLAAEGKLKAEQLKQQQLAEEEQRRLASEAERQRLLAAKSEDDRKLAELKAAAEARRKAAETQAAPRDFATLDAAVAEIKRLSARIEQIETGYARDLAQTRQQIEARYAARFAALDAEKKDEFDSQASFVARIDKKRSELQGQKAEELGRLNVQQLADAETAPLKTQIKTLAERQYTLGAEHLQVDLGTYDGERQQFNIEIRPLKPGQQGANGPLQLAYSGALALPPQEARAFKQQWSAGLVRAEVAATPGAGAQRVAVVNDADQTRREHEAGRFETAAQKQARLAREAQEAALEREAQRYRPKMVSIPAGSFDMGSNKIVYEKPIHRVDVPAFQVAATEVTQAQWGAVMGNNPSHFSRCGDDCPVENVSWDDVQQYLQKLKAKTGKDYRLPSEAEWEYAARAGTTTVFHTGNCVNTSQANYDGNHDYNNCGAKTGLYRQKTLPTGSFAANAFGLHDMIGNVWEWTSDCWNANYVGAPTEGKAWTTGDCGRRVLRGGSWLSFPLLARSAIRFRLTSGIRDNSVGFRVALSSARTR